MSEWHESGHTLVNTDEPQLRSAKYPVKFDEPVKFDGPANV